MNKTDQAGPASGRSPVSARRLRRRGPRFLVILFTVSVLVHGYVGLRLIPSLQTWPAAAVPLATFLLLSALLTPASLLIGRLRSRRAAEWLAWTGLLCMGLFSSLFVLTVLRDALLLAAAVIHLRIPFDWSSLQTDSAVSVAGAALAITLLGFINARRTPAVVDVDVPIAGLAPDLDGLTIVQISDVHIGRTIRRPYLQAIVERVNALQADLVAITGDLVDGDVAELATQVEPLATLSSRHGSYFVTGNHEYYSGARQWMAHLRTLDVQVLDNRHLVIPHRSAKLVVAGVTDFSAGAFDPAAASDPQAALAGAPANVFRLLLAHQPRSIADATAAGVDLQLSGHTHGGQFLPWNFFVKLQQPLVAGLHRVGNTWVYVSRGSGYWGPPKRFGAPSEITRLRLRAAARCAPRQ